MTTDLQPFGLAAQAVTEVTGVTLAEMQGSSRKAYIVDARSIFAAILDMEYISSVQIGEALNRAHASAIHLRTRHENYYEYEPPYEALYNKCLLHYYRLKLQAQCRQELQS